MPQSVRMSRLSIFVFSLFSVFCIICTTRGTDSHDDDYTQFVVIDYDLCHEQKTNCCDFYTRDVYVMNCVQKAIRERQLLDQNKNVDGAHYKKVRENLSFALQVAIQDDPFPQTVSAIIDFCSKSRLQQVVTICTFGHHNLEQAYDFFAPRRRCLQTEQKGYLLLKYLCATHDNVFLQDEQNS